MNLFHLEEQIFEQIQTLEEANNSDQLALEKYRLNPKVNPVAVTVLTERLQKRRTALHNLNKFFNCWLEANAVTARANVPQKDFVRTQYSRSTFDDRDFPTSNLFDV